MTEKLRLPPGIYHNGTEYMAAGRYGDCNLIRWHNEIIKSISGWQRRYKEDGTPVSPLWGDGFATEAARSCLVLANTTLGIDLFIGTNKEIYQISSSNVITEVTPAGFTAQPKDSTLNRGYGVFRYGWGPYGTARPSSQSQRAAVFSWGFAEWGEWPIACARGVATAPLYIKTNLDTTFVPIANSPQGAFDVTVTDERFVMTFGKNSDPRLVEWSDQEDYTFWNPASITKQAGNRRLAGTGRLVAGIKTASEILILGENDAFTCQYVGPPYVYGFSRVGDKCGVIGPEAVVAAAGVVMWAGSKSFWIFDGTIKPLDCEVLDYYLMDRDPNQISKTFAFSISDYSEVWWLYQSSASPTGDVDKYLVYNYAMRVWYYGSIRRTIGADSNPLDYVMMVSADGVIFDHEMIGASHGGNYPYITTGPLELENGQRLLGVSYVYPDDYLDGSVMMDLMVRDMPKAPVRYSRTFDLTMINPENGVSTMGIMGRDVRMKLYGAVGGNPNWKVGNFRVDTLGGTRR